MRPENTEAKKAARRREAVRGVILFALLQLCCAGGLWALAMIPGLPGWCRVLFWILAAGCALLVLPAGMTLKQRFDEIEGGELDAAGKY